MIDYNRWHNDIFYAKKNSDLTVSIAFLKRGLVSEEGKKHIKRLVNMDIGIVLEEA